MSLHYTCCVSCIRALTWIDLIRNMQPKPMKENIISVLTEDLFFFLYLIYNAVVCVLLRIECSAVERFNVHTLEQLVWVHFGMCASVRLVICPMMVNTTLVIYCLSKFLRLYWRVGGQIKENKVGGVYSTDGEKYIRSSAWKFLRKVRVI